MLDMYIFLIYIQKVEFDPSRYCGFQWDSGNDQKNLHKHGVSCEEAQQIFLNQPLIVGDDEKHSRHEPRYRALGMANHGRLLYVTFTLRGNLVRIISARSMHRRERSFYEKE